MEVSKTELLRKGLESSIFYTSHELVIRFQYKGSCEGPYTLITVLDYNARYNKTLKSFLSTQQ